MELKEGDTAPEIKLKTDRDEWFQLSDLRGQKVILYFYPRADTPGCTVEACEFRDESRKFDRKNAVIVGISPDTPTAQEKFKAKFDLPFTLLCDTDKVVAKAYGVLKEKNMYGKKVIGIERSTFVIDEKGRIEKIFGGVKAKGHAGQVLQAI
jgi:peroxiredoxin Q/BCP